MLLSSGTFQAEGSDPFYVTMMLTMFNVLQVIVLFCVSYFIYVFPFQVLLLWSFDKLLPISTLVFVTFCIASLLLFYFKTKTQAKSLKLLVKFGVGVCFFLNVVVCLLCLIDYVYLLQDLTKVIFALAVTSFLVIYSLYKGKIIELKTIVIETDKIAKPCQFVFISDVHIGTQSVEYLNMLLDKIKALNPDYVCIGGDLVDSSAVTINQLKAFKTLSMPVYFVTGNHEYYLKQSTQLLNQLKDVNIQWINNDSVQFADINIIGVNDNQSINLKNKLIKKHLDSKLFNIALVHKPHCFDLLTTKPDLMLSGHTHNGQTFPFNFVVKLNFPKCYGLYRDNNATFYVSSGAGTWGTTMRFGTVNEVVLVKLIQG